MKTEVSVHCEENEDLERIQNIVNIGVLAKAPFKNVVNNGFSQREPFIFLKVSSGRLGFIFEQF